MKKNLVLLLVLATALSSACSKPSATITALNPGDVVPKNDTWPAYKDQIVSGKVFGNDWQAVSAAVRPVLNNSDELFLDIYGENVEDACTPQMNLEQPMMTVIIPANYGLTEYVSDMLNLGNTQTGNPATFISYGSVSKNVVSEKMKLQVVSISDTGFDLNLFASAKETNGTMTEINGKISVIDCRKKISFKTWIDMTGTYKLTSFNGKVVKNVISYQVEIDKEKRFYDRKTQKYLTTVVFPLFQAVSDNSTTEFEFGPIDGFGSTEMSQADGVKTYKYSYSGPLNYKGVDVTITLNMKVLQKPNELAIEYTLDVPGYISRTTHKFSLTK